MIVTPESSEMLPHNLGNQSILNVATWPEFQPQSHLREDAILWHRAVPKMVQDWLDRIPDTCLPSGRFRLAPTEISTCIETMFGEVDITNHPALSWLCRDAERLGLQVATLHAVPSVRLRVEAVFDDACRKFHIDNVVARLICTYRGPGTELSLKDGDMNEIETVPTGVPVLLKGKKWPQTENIKLYHRSPPIQGTGISRLVLVLDPIHEDDEIGTSYDRRFKREWI